MKTNEVDRIETLIVSMGLLILGSLAVFNDRIISGIISLFMGGLFFFRWYKFKSNEER